MVAAACLTCLAVGLAAHYSPVIDNHIESDLERQREINGMYFYSGGYVDGGDNVLLGQVARADFSRGGVYFIGASETAISIRPWELPPEEQALIHNYSLGDLRHRDVLHYVRSLVEDHGLLQAGGEKTTIILGLSYQMTRGRDFALEKDRYVPTLFERHGFYTYDVEGGVHLAPMTPAERFLRAERIYANGFLQIFLQPKSEVKVRKQTPQEFHDYLSEAMGPDWLANLEEEVRYIGETIDYLQARGVRVRAIYPPMASWQQGLPFDAAYRERLKPILEARNVPVSDFKDLLPDDDFGDAIHARYTGELKMHNAYRKLALKALADMESGQYQLGGGGTTALHQRQ
jgi:hypothetical protein